MTVVNEIWMGIEGYPLYEVSNLGNVRSWAKPGRAKGRGDKPTLLAQTLRKGNTDYYAVNLYNENGSKYALVHQLVTEAFHGKRPEGMITRHINGNGLDNRAENLTWGTYAENTADRYVHGTANFTGQKVEPVLTDEEAYDIWLRAEAGETVRDIHKDYPHACYEAVRLVARGKARAKAIKGFLEAQSGTGLGVAV